jgi:Fe-S-cluster-containing hydrogenase component 2
MPVFSLLDASSVTLILQESRVFELKPQQRLSGLGRHTKGESYCFVLAGEMAVVVDRAGRAATAIKDQIDRNTVQYVASFAPGDLFSDGYLDIGPGDGATLDCVASTSVTLLATPVELLGQLLRGNGAWAAGLASTVAASRRRFLSQQEPTRQIVQDFYLRHGLGAGQRVRVSEMGHCLDCDKCEQACAARHGHARMARAHVRLGRLAFQKLCLNCTEQSCLAACAFDAMTVGAAGEIRIGDGCNGCGACARKCPYGAIEIVDVPYGAADFASPVPISDDSGRTGWPGLYVAGDVSGPRSTKIAIGEAKRAVDAMQVRPLEPSQHAVLDVIIVGAGTAGIAAAKRCAERQLRYLVLEKSSALPAAVARVAPVLHVQPGTEVAAIASSEHGHLRVDVARGAYLAQNVLVCTGKAVPGQPSLLGRAGIPAIQPGSKEMTAYIASRGSHSVASKCDNCAGFPDRACERACPTKSLVEIAPQSLFFTRAAGGGEERRFSGVAFVEGVAEHRARTSQRNVRAWTIFAAALVLALVAVGLESFLRRVLPEHSVAGIVRARLGITDPVWFKSGRGYGHWLGYVGTGFMLATLFYPLRTRLGVLKSWGVQSTWLTFHLWVGFIGATLVTYHAAFKLDRWVALACYAMWTVVLSGAIGRYLYGTIHSGIGLADFEREALSRNTPWQATTQHLRARGVGILTADAERPGPIYTELFVMLWHELRDFAILLWLRFFGLSHLPSRSARRAQLRYLSDIAVHRRARRNLESARRLLRYWNWVHIVLTIAMFVLSGFHITYGFMYKAV